VRGFETGLGVASAHEREIERLHVKIGELSRSVIFLPGDPEDELPDR